MIELKNIVFVIPSLEPRNTFIELLDEMRKSPEINDATIIVINDGSNSSYANYFEKAEKEYGCIVLEHSINLGKGRALKTAINYILLKYPTASVVTLDSDGQHLVKDVVQCAKEINNSSDSLILGARRFDSKDIPFRSRFGNKLTKRVFSFLCGISVDDTQTGLRGIPNNYLRPLMAIEGERFEYEMNMLIETRENNIQTKSFDIETVYINDNETSHFNPLTDSLKVYSVFLKYFFSAVSSFGVDILLFYLFKTLLKNLTSYYIIFATVLARIVSSIFNYFINKKVVFKSKSKDKASLYQYIILVTVQMFVSGFFVHGISQIIPRAEVPIKIAVDSILFLVNYVVQNKIIFKQGE